jgi:RHS repeat-associated protein
LVTAALAADGMTAAYTYDALGRRTQKVVAGGVYAGTTAYLDSGDDEVAEYDGTGTLTRRFVPGYAVDQPIAMVSISSGATTFFYTDRQGSVLAMADASGTLTEGPFSYDAYGRCRSAGVACNAVGTEPFHYTGQYYDPETRLHYYRARYYSAATGRFLQTDPVGYKDDLNWYAYVGNDPMNGSDPTGLVDEKKKTGGCGWSTGTALEAGSTKKATHRLDCLWQLFRLPLVTPLHLSPQKLNLPIALWS